VTGITVVGIAVAEPKSNRAAILTLEVDVVCAMLFAVFDSCAHTDSRTLWTDELLSLEIAILLVGLVAVYHTAKVGRFALEAHIVSTLIKSKLL
jgi:hypothetical protein